MVTEKILQQKRAWAKQRKQEANALRYVRDTWSFIGLFLAAFWAIIIYLICSFVGCQPAHAETIDMHKIMMIESGGRNIPSTIKSEHAAGIYQITPVVMKEFNDSGILSYEINHEDLYNTKINHYVAEWYLTKRIPQMLKAYKKPVTVRNILIAYNAGISYVVKDKNLPAVTVAYLRKYGVA